MITGPTSRNQYNSKSKYPAVGTLIQLWNHCFFFCLYLVLCFCWVLVSIFYGYMWFLFFHFPLPTSLCAIMVLWVILMKCSFKIWSSYSLRNHFNIWIEDAVASFKVQFFFFPLMLLQYLSFFSVRPWRICSIQNSTLFATHLQNRIERHQWIFEKMIRQAAMTK